MSTITDGTLALVRNAIELACAEHAIKPGWIEVERRDTRRKCYQTVTSRDSERWYISFEAEMPNGFGSIRHQIVHQSGGVVEQAIAMIVQRIAAKAKSNEQDR